MRFIPGVFLVCALGVCADTNSTPAVDPAVARAQENIEKLRQLVDAGAVPRMQLERAEADLADAQDVAVLRRTLYGQELTPDLVDEMVAAARRRLERRQKELDRAKKLVDEGVAGLSSLGTYLEDLDRARKEFDLAESRARLTDELARMAEQEAALQRHLSESS